MFQHVRFTAARGFLVQRSSRRRSASWSHLRNRFAVLGILFAVSACGSSGSSDSEPEPNPPAPLPPPTVTLLLSHAEISAGGNSVLTWSSTNADSCLATGDWTGYRARSGSQELTPSNPGSYQYRLTCGGSGGESTSSVELRVTAPPTVPAPTLTLQLAPTRVTAGRSATLSWSSTGAQACTASDAWSGSQATAGSLAITQPAAGTYTYTLNCQGAGGGVSRQAELTVTEPPTPPPAPTISLTISSTRIARGETATLNWTSTQATTCSASGAWTGIKSIAGTETVSPTAVGSYTYALECSGAGGSVRAEGALVVVESTPPPPAPTLTLTISPTQIDVGASATISWSAAHVDSCVASGSWGGVKSPSGSLSVTPSEVGTYTYVLECSNASGSIRTPRQLVVQQPPPPTATISVSPEQIEIGQTATVTWSSTKADRCTGSGAWSGDKSVSGSASVSPTAEGTYTYALNCQGAGGNKAVETTLLVVSPPPPRPKPIITLSVTPARIMAGADATVSWATTNGGACIASGDRWSGAQPTSGSIVVSPTFAGTHPYALSCDGNGEPLAKTVDLVVFEPAVIHPAQPSKARVGTMYSQALSVVNGTGSYSWSLAAGALPAGIRLSTNGVLSGTPTTAGSASFTAQARNAAGDVVKRILLLAVAAPSCPEPGAQPADPAPRSDWQWEKVTRPMVSGLPSFIRIDPEDINVQYLATATDLFVSHDAGTTWVQSVRGGSVASIEFEPGNSCIAYALISVSGGRAIFRSTDRGRTWIAITSPMRASSGLLISRVTPGLMLVGGSMVVDGAQVAGFHRSTDGGATWSFAKVEYQYSNLIFWDIEEDVDGVLYSGSEIDDHPQPYAPPFFRSKDGGATWENSTTGLNWHVTSIQSDPDKSLVYAMQEGSGLYKTLDAGTTWNFVSFEEPAAELVIHPARPHEIYVSQIQHPEGGQAGGVFASTDRGVTYQHTGLVGHKAYHALSLAHSNRYLYTIGGDYWIWRVVIPTQSP